LAESPRQSHPPEFTGLSENGIRCVVHFAMTRGSVQTLFFN
jgi:hypothetical protein